ncbi:hypothetical protein K2D_09390 [Enterococcus hirae]|nr:hypothetical protein K2D_09390 [Enterococcus hirae]
MRLPLLSLGLWQNFGDYDPISNQREILRGAFDMGITHFDLAKKQLFFTTQTTKKNFLLFFNIKKGTTL